MGLKQWLSQPPRGYEAWYAGVSAWWCEKSARARMLGRVCEVLKIACYVVYPALIAGLWLQAGRVTEQLVFAVGVPATGFLLVSALRVYLNEPRPYEACDISHLIEKDTQGRSFPSRHVFSIFVIGMCWLRFHSAVGLVILAAGFVMAAARVLGGVHYPRDVIAGIVLGVAWGFLMWCC